MSKTKIRLGAALLGLIITTALVAGGTYAFSGHYFKGGQKFDPELKQSFIEKREAMEAKRGAIEEALENNDYNAWVEAVGEDCPMLEKINESNFSKLIEIHQLRGQIKGIMEELGIEKDGFGHKGLKIHWQ